MDQKRSTCGQSGKREIKMEKKYHRDSSILAKHRMARSSRDIISSGETRVGRAGDFAIPIGVQFQQMQLVLDAANDAPLMQRSSVERK